MQVIAPMKETTDILVEEGGDILKMCYQCGLCTGVCPWNQLTTFELRKLIHKTQLGTVDFEDEEVWRCVGCKACVERCPRGVDVPYIMRAIRRVITEIGAGAVPQSLRVTEKNISAVGNPLGEPQEKRMDWAKDLGVKTFTTGTEILYFPCCYQTYDPPAQKAARATVDILKKANVDFGIPDSNVVCCGESIRKAGAEGLFQRLAKTNIDIFAQLGVKKILVTSPHCYHTFKDEYPELGGNYEVVHLSQYLAELITEGRLKLTKEINKKVTYHDSCCLGRWQGIYDEHREILSSIPGIEFVEMRDSREYALCCGGCAGRLWLETKKGERMSELRLEQALDVGASTLAISCPYCMANFNDSVVTMDKADVIDVRDISELVAEAL
ncbi:MAG TPA: (Fe-S)-binding protein [Dehalococcoidia bacterium]|nr:(Fe-S)-binding protein [Dehalococcoidia bacterium]